MRQLNAVSHLVDFLPARSTSLKEAEMQRYPSPPLIRRRGWGIPRTGEWVKREVALTTARGRCCVINTTLFGCYMLEAITVVAAPVGAVVVA